MVAGGPWGSPAAILLSCGYFFFEALTLIRNARSGPRLARTLTCDGLAITCVIQPATPRPAKPVRRGFWSFSEDICFAMNRQVREPGRTCLA